MASDFFVHQVAMLRVCLDNHLPPPLAVSENDPDHEARNRPRRPNDSVRSTIRVLLDKLIVAQMEYTFLAFHEFRRRRWTFSSEPAESDLRPTCLRSVSMGEKENFVSKMAFSVCATKILYAFLVSCMRANVGFPTVTRHWFNDPIDVCLCETCGRVSSCGLRNSYSRSQ